MAEKNTTKICGICLYDPLESRINAILFDDGTSIEVKHEQDCGEENYADFSQLEPEAMDFEFTTPIAFEKVDHAGFRFGNRNKRMFFVPCYSSQNGYYSENVNVYYNGEKMLSFDCSFIKR